MRDYQIYLAEKEEIISECQEIFQEAKNSNDINKMLVIFPEKGLSNQIASVFDLRNYAYISLILRKLNTEDSLMEKFKLKLPKIQEDLL